MIPVRFGSPDRLCVGFHHQPAGAARQTAVLICPSWGREYMRSYRGVRMVAHRLAMSGFETLRFDYSGTGDSYGHALDASVDHWVADTRAAAQELRDLSGASRIAVLGVRFGALIAESALRDRPDVRLRAYWDPPASGAEFVDVLRRLSAEYDHAQRWRRRRDMQLPPHDPNELFGQAWPPAVAEALPRLTVPLDDPDRLWIASSDHPAPPGVPADQVLDGAEESHWDQVRWIYSLWTPVAAAERLALQLEGALP